MTTEYFMKRKCTRCRSEPARKRVTITYRYKDRPLKHYVCEKCIVSFAQWCGDEQY